VSVQIGLMEHCLYMLLCEVSMCMNAVRILDLVIILNVRQAASFSVVFIPIFKNGLL